jgi:L-aspartate oxidase
VFGAQFAALTVPRPVMIATSPTISRSIALTAADCLWIDQVRLDLPKLVWQAAGICRQAATLDAAIGQVAIWTKQFNQLPSALSTPTKFAQLANWAELRNLLDVSQMLLKSARYRTESRGGHYRSDYPTTQTNWQVHTMIQGDRWSQGPVDRGS